MHFIRRERVEKREKGRGRRERGGRVLGAVYRCSFVSRVSYRLYVVHTHLLNSSLTLPPLIEAVKPARAITIREARPRAIPIESLRAGPTRRASTAAAAAG